MRAMRLLFLTALISLSVASPVLAGPGDVFGPAGYAGTRGDMGLVRQLVREKSQPLRNETARERQRRRVAGEKAPARLNALVMMCDFSDSLLLGRHGEVPGDFPPPMQTDRYYAAHDSLFFAHQLSKVADYFTTVSGGALDIDYTVYPKAINLPFPMAYYGNHPELGEQSVLMAAQVVDSLATRINMSSFDTFILVHAGAGEETDILGNSPEQIFSTYLDPDDFVTAVEDSVLAQPYLPAAGFPAGTGIDRVLILPETEQQDPIGGFGGGFGSLGVYCFEFGLHLGMLSLSDFTPAGRPDSQGIGQYGLMGYGLFVGLGFIPPHPCAYNKVLMGWLDPYEADVAEAGRHYLTPAEAPANPLACARVNLTGQEFWLLEYRLQDPNGDRRYTFGDDKNHNGLPDFYDMDSTVGGGIPTGKFDAATDSLERVTDAEWDFAMSENSARVLGELGWGSGVYVWHIDEGLIADVFDAPRNLFNADPAHKSVDLEEADGIQDLDSNEPSPYLLGSDDDSFRGEFGSAFTPETSPGTETAAGARSGVTFTNFSEVVADSFVTLLFTDPETGVEYWSFAYADSMSFELGLEGEDTGALAQHARRDLPPGTDLRGSHVLVGNLDQQGGTDEIILAGHQGEVFVLDGDLNEFLDRDGDVATLEPFVVGTRGGEPVHWNLPPALGDLDGDGELEIVLTDGAGVYAFNQDATSVRSLAVDSFGLYAATPGCSLPPVLLPVSGESAVADPDSVVPVQAVAVTQDLDGAHLVFLTGSDAGESTIDLGAGVVPSTPVAIDRFVAAAIADTSGADSRLVVTELVVGGMGVTPASALEIPLSGQPGPLPLSAGVTPDSKAQDPVFYVTVIDTAGRGETVFFDRNLSVSRAGVRWPVERVVAAPLGLGGAFVADDILGRVGTGGDWLTGWPQRPLAGGLLDDVRWQGQPLAARLVNTTHNLDQFIFPTRDGRMFARGARGEAESGWPLAGPGASAGTPALGHLTGFSDTDLVSIGTFDRVVGTEADGSLRTEPFSTIVVWQDVAASRPVWGQYGGSAWRNGAFDQGAWQPGFGTAPGTGLVPGSHFCFPSPLESGPLKVSGVVRRAARVQVIVYNLEGERVQGSGWQEVVGVEPFVVSLDLPVAVTGLYLCRLVVDTPGAGTEDSVIQFAVVR